MATRFGLQRMHKDITNSHDPGSQAVIGTHQHGPFTEEGAPCFVQDLCGTGQQSGLLLEQIALNLKIYPPTSPIDAVRALLPVIEHDEVHNNRLASMEGEWDMSALPFRLKSKRLWHPVMKDTVSLTPEGRLVDSKKPKGHSGFWEYLHPVTTKKRTWAQHRAHKTPLMWEPALCKERAKQDSFSHVHGRG